LSGTKRRCLTTQRSNGTISTHIFQNSFPHGMSPFCSYPLGLCLGRFSKSLARLTERTHGLRIVDLRRNREGECPGWVILRSAVWRRSDILLTGCWQITTPCSSLKGAVIVSIQSPVGEPRMKRQLDPDQEASEGPIIRPEEHPQ